MSEEFKPIRITLSQEAFDRLNYIMKMASFRSNSSAIEECIRVVYDIILEITPVVGDKDEPFKPFIKDEVFQTFTNIATRLSRFTGRGVGLRPQE